MAFEIPDDMHPDVLAFAWLLGTWHGDGKGDYPTIDPFAFEQEVAFAHDGRPFLHYFSRAWVTDDDGNRLRPGALETGFLRPAGELAEGKGDIELVLAHNTGFAEVWVGEIDGPRIELATDVVARTQSAKEYNAGKRMYGLVDGDLMYAYDMAAQGEPMQSHTWGRLKRV